MKTTVVPAQIITYEDRVAGNLTFQQIILLVMSLILGTAIYGLISPRLHVSALKTVLILSQFAVLGSLAVRISGMILLEWLVIYIRYKSRPRVYIYSKSDLFGREILLPSFKGSKTAKTKKEEAGEGKVGAAFKTQESLPYSLVYEDNFSLSVKPAKKGGLDVVFRDL